MDPAGSAPRSRIAGLFSFPNPVNDVSARLTAGFVVVLSVVTLATRERWLLLPLAYGFVARVATGPSLSPIAQLVVRAITPRLPFSERPTPGPPKRFAQGIGAAFTVSAAVAAFVFHAALVAWVLIGVLAVFATLESAFGLCMGCKMFALLMRIGVIPNSVCEECADITRRYPELAKS